MNVLIIKPFQIKGVWFGDNQMIIYTDFGEFFSKETRVISRLLKLFYNQIGLTMDDYRKIDRDVLGKLITNLVKRRKNGIKLEVKGNEIINIFSEIYKHIPPRLVLTSVDNVLKSRKMEFESKVKINGTLEAIWIIKETIDRIAKPIIWCFNKNDGRTAMRIGFGYFSISCTNIARSWRQSKMIKVIHKEPETSIRRKIIDATTVIATQIPTFLETVRNAISISISKKEGRDFIIGMDLPKFIKSAVKHVWYSSKEETLWALSNAFSFVATHYSGLSDSRKIQLDDLSIRVLDYEYFKKIMEENRTCQATLLLSQ